MEDTTQQGQATFRIELEGRIIDGRDRDTVMESLMRLFSINAERAESLLADTSFVIKRGLNEEQAQKYITAIERAGAVCRMTPEQPEQAEEPQPKAVCPKCGHEAVDARDPLAATGECPACGIIVSKYLKAHGREVQDPPSGETPQPSTGHAPPIFTEEEFVSFPARGPLVSLFGFCPLENPVHVKDAAGNLQTASVYHRFWATAATFCHCLFMGVLMQVPVGIAGGIYLKTNDMELTRTTADALRGLSFLLGFCYVTVLLPLFWRGHTFGMRAMRIVLIDLRYEHEIGLSPQSSFLRVLAGIIKWLTVLPLAVPLFNKNGYGFEDLLLKTRQAAVDKLPAGPWNIALRSFAAAILLHFAIALPSSCILGDIGKQNIHGPARAPGQVNSSEEITPDSGVSPAARSALMQLRAAVMQHTAKNSSPPDGPEQFKAMLTRAFSANSRFLQMYNEGDLGYRGGFSSFELGLRQDDSWAIIDQDGRLSTRDSF